MDLIKLAYGGRKPFNDKRYGSFREWQPGDEHLVSPMAAKKLLKFAEFKAVPTKAVKPAPATKGEEQKDLQQNAQAQQEEAERAAVIALVHAQEQAQQQEHQAKEEMLLAISNWDKDQLKEYAAKYDVNINKTSALQSIREEVAGLVEQFGVR